MKDSRTSSEDKKQIQQKKKKVIKKKLSDALRKNLMRRKSPEKTS